MKSSKDKLFLIQPDFLDPAFPGRRFYCWHCALIEGVLFAFPHLAEHLDIERVPWPRPRRKVIDIVGEANQSLPLLVLPEGEDSEFRSGSYQNRTFINDKDKILAVLSERHGFPEAHP